MIPEDDAQRFATDSSPNPGFLPLFGDELGMALIDTVMGTVHLVAGGVLTGSVVYFAWAIARVDATVVGSEAVGQLASSLTFVSRICAGLLLVSGGYMAAVLGSALRGTSGMLVGVMILLWLVVTALVEIGNSRLANGASLRDVRQFYVVAAVAALLLLVNAGYIAAA